MESQKPTPVALLKQEMQFRNYSTKSTETYCQLMDVLEQSLHTPLADISVKSFKAYLHQRITVEEVSTSTVNQSISAFKLLQTEVFNRDWEQLKIKRPRRIKKLPVVLSTNELERLIQVTTNIKHRALLMLTYSSGLRRNEVIQMRPQAIDSERMRVHVVQGKGRKDRYTLLSQKTLDLLRYYYKVYRPSQFLFEARGSHGKPLSGNTLRSIIKQNAVKAGINKAVSFHTLRHCFATHLLEQGVNLRLIQSFMGHTSLKTTAKYLHLANVDISNVVSPLDAMNL